MIMTKMNLLKKLAAQYPTQKKPNQYWAFDFENCLIVNRQSGKILSKGDLPFLDLVQKYFQSIYDAFGTEAQCTIIEKKYLAQVADYLPRMTVGDFALLILPQTNSVTGSVASMKVLQTEILNKQIPVFAHAHSHDHFDAYRSSTDYNGLNSNTLEMVFGNFHTPNPNLTLWLDSRNPEVKEPTYRFNQEGKLTLFDFENKFNSWR